MHSTVASRNHRPRPAKCTEVFLEAPKNPRGPWWLQKAPKRIPEQTIQDGALVDPCLGLTRLKSRARMEEGGRRRNERKREKGGRKRGQPQIANLNDLVVSKCAPEALHVTLARRNRYADGARARARSTSNFPIKSEAGSPCKTTC